MADHVSPETRSRIMARVKNRDTKPEMTVRRLLHAMGYRFRLHRKDLPGRPDIVLPRHRRVVFVHGCFWHGHTCRPSLRPSSNTEFWNGKIDGNKARDVRDAVALENAGWHVLILWECQIADQEALRGRLLGFLGASKIDRPPN